MRKRRLAKTHPSHISDQSQGDLCSPDSTMKGIIAKLNTRERSIIKTDNTVHRKYVKSHRIIRIKVIPRETAKIKTDMIHRKYVKTYRIIQIKVTEKDYHCKK